MATFRNATDSDAAGVTGRRRSGALLVILCGLFLSLPAPVAAQDVQDDADDPPFEAVFEAEITAGLSNYVYGYFGDRSVGSIMITRGAGDPLASLVRHYRGSSGGHALYMPENTTEDADSLFDRVRVVADGQSHTAWRHEATVSTPQGHRAWIWSRADGGNILSGTVGATYTLQFSRPQAGADFGGVYEATVTTGRDSQYYGYEYPNPYGYGSLVASDPDPDSGTADPSEHIGEVVGIMRFRREVQLRLPKNVANHEDVFQIMRISRDGHFWDFRRDEAVYSSSNAAYELYRWSRDRDAITTTYGDTFTLTFKDATLADCVWLREWDSCTGGSQTMTPVAGRWSDTGGVWAWAPTPGCTPPGPAPVSITQTCTGGCEFQGDAADQDARGNIGCFHTP